MVSTASNRRRVELDEIAATEVRIDPATLPQPMSEEQVEAERHRQEEHRDLLQVLTPSGKLKTYRMTNERFHRVPSRRQGGDVVSVMPRRTGIEERAHTVYDPHAAVRSRQG
jgi:hypothetical protein